jgi:hypothetical protein
MLICLTYLKKPRLHKMRGFGLGLVARVPVQTDQTAQVLHQHLLWDRGNTLLRKLSKHVCAGESYDQKLWMRGKAAYPG